MRRELSLHINTQLRNMAVVVTQPDHPLLLSGPDVLAGNAGDLYAFFVPKAHEFTRPSDLLVRLAACRLALPAHTLCAIIVEVDSLPKDSEHHFDAAVQTAEIARVTQAGLTRRPPRGDLVEARRQAYRRAAVLIKETLEFALRNPPLQPNRVLHEFVEHTDAEYVIVPSWSRSQKGRRSQRLLKGGDFVAAVAHFSEGRSIRRTLDPLISYGIRLQYSLDSGIPYLTSDSLNTILVDEIPRAPHDPLKPMRCAAFFGWIMLAPTSFADYERAVDRIDRKLRAAKTRQ